MIKYYQYEKQKHDHIYNRIYNHKVNHTMDSKKLYVMIGVLILVCLLAIVKIIGSFYNISDDNISDDNISNNTHIDTLDESNDTQKDPTKYRRVYLKNTKFYFLTVNNEKRKKHILQEFKEYNPIEINPIVGISRNMSGSSGFSRMVDKGLRDQDNTRPFQPFVMLEDDASKYREFPEYIDIPIDADIVYLGLHSWGYSKDEAINTIFADDVDNDLMRVKNLLALHGVMICSAAGGAVFERCMTESYYRDKPWDIPITHAQPFYKVYALKTPLVYQDYEYGGKESVTKIKAKTGWFKPIPEKHINQNGTSNLLGWNQIFE